MIFKDVQEYDGTPYEGYYTQEEIKDIVSYANDRFVTIIPEIDLPGHASALIAAYPELGSSTENIGVKTIWGPHPDIVKPTENTFNFLTSSYANKSYSSIISSLYVTINFPKISSFIIGA